MPSPSLLLLLLLLTILTPTLNAQTYNTTKTLFKELLDIQRYDPKVRPMMDQSETIYVEVYFRLLSIDSVNDSRQTFVCNGFLSLYWKDELLTWDPYDTDTPYLLYPLPKQVWRPRLLLLNTLGDRDLFKDDISPVLVLYNSSVIWNPGSVFTTSCALSLLKYPFDEQNCRIVMMSMGLSHNELEFMPGSVLLEFFTGSGEWNLMESRITTSTRFIDDIEVSTFEIHFRIQRRSTFYTLNIILPFVCLSFLNMLIFTIPQESGEKISYGITVLLAMSVFLSIIGEMLPKSSDTVPHVIVYLFILFLLSALSVIDSIFIVFLHHLEESGEHKQRILSKFKRMVSAVKESKNGVDSFAAGLNTSTTTSFMLGDLKDIQRPTEFNYMEVIELEADRKERCSSQRDTGHSQKDDKCRNRKEKGHSERGKGDNTDSCNGDAMTYKKMASSMDMASFGIFLLSWVSVTTWFFVTTAL